MEDKQALLDALKFHGHMCWASVAGVRIGLAALRHRGNRRRPRRYVLWRRCAICYRLYLWQG